MLPSVDSRCQCPCCTELFSYETTNRQTHTKCMQRYMQGLFVPFACVGSGDPVRVCCTTNALNTIEAFIAETNVQLVATETTCYSTSWSALLESVLANCSHAI